MKTEVVASINKHSNTLRSKYKALRSKTQMQNEYKMVLEANTSTKSTSEAIQIQKVEVAVLILVYWACVSTQSTADSAQLHSIHIWVGTSPYNTGAQLGLHK